MSPPVTTTTQFATMEGMPVTLPSGAETRVLTEDEVAYVTDRAERYTTDNHFYNVSDVQDVDRMVMLELLCWRAANFLNRGGLDYFDKAVDEPELRRSLTSMCVDIETEILTLAGWRTYDAIAVGDHVLTLDMDSGFAAWQPLKAIHIHQDGPYPVMEIATRDHDSVSTMDHRWPVRPSDGESRDTAALRFVQTWRLLPDHSLVTWAPGGAAAEPKFADSFVEIIGWFWTEGSSRRNANGRFYNGTIHQSRVANLAHCLEIERALTDQWGAPYSGPLPHNDRGNALWRMKDEDNGQRRFYLSRTALAQIQRVFDDFENKVLGVPFLASLTQSQLERLIAVSVGGDGWETRWVAYDSERTSFSLRQAHEGRATQFATALALAGYPSTVNYETGWVTPPGAKLQWFENWRVAPRVRRANCPLRALKAGRRVPVFSTRQIVWCPETENGTWFAKRNGKTFYTGNSSEIRQLKKILRIDKNARDAERGENSVAAYLENLRHRAAEFGVHRDRQAAKVLELGMQLIALGTYHQNCTIEEQRELGITLDDLYQWIMGVFAVELAALDRHFRQGQKMWIRDL